MTDTHKESLSGHDNAVLNKIFNPNMPFDESAVESSSQFEPDRKFLIIYQLIQMQSKLIILRLKSTQPDVTALSFDSRLSESTEDSTATALEVEGVSLAESGELEHALELLNKAVQTLRLLRLPAPSFRSATASLSSWAYQGPLHGPYEHAFPHPFQDGLGAIAKSASS